jgi:hypothetical protein
MFARIEQRTKAATNAAQAVLRSQPICNTTECRKTRAEIEKAGYLGRLIGPAAYTMYGLGGGPFKYIFYISLSIFVIFLIITFIHFTMFPMYSFTSGDAGFIPVPTSSDRQIAYKTVPAVYDLSANLPGLPACTYTLGADIYLSGNFMVSKTPRVILYRSNGNPVIDGGMCDDTTYSPCDSALLESYPDSNIIVWLDPVKNDLYVSAITGGENTMLETTSTIENVPIKKVFRLSIVFTSQFLEVYINGKLEQSMPIRQPLISLAPSSVFFPTIKPILQNVMIGNLTMWPRVLTAREIRANEGGPMKTGTFFFENS